MATSEQHSFNQAILILAHGNIQQLIALSKRLSEYFLVYIHYDAKNYPNIPPDFKQELKSIPNVYILSKYTVNWGAFSIVEATMFLISEVLKNKSVKYLHLISGQDWLAKPAKAIYDFFDGSNKIYITYDLAKNIVKTHENVLLWQKLYYPYDTIKRKTFFGKIFHRVSMLAQIICFVNKFRRYKINYDIFAGSQWWSMPREACEYVNSVYMANEPIVKVMKTGFCSDEMFFQTILVNSEMFKEQIVNDNLRYISWIRKNNSYPAILDIDDYENVSKDNIFFMRKIDFNISRELIDKISI